MSFGQINTTELKSGNLLVNQLDDDFSGRDIINENEYLNRNYHERQKAIKNNMTLVTVLNCFSICSNIFSVSFYQWYAIRQNVWLNLLYIFDYDGRDQTYNHYMHTCVDNIDESSSETQYPCIDNLMFLKWVGYISFGLLMVSLSAQVYDIFRLRRILKNLSINLKTEKSRMTGYMVYSLIILSKFIALLIYFIATQVCNDSSSHFGCCFWLSLITCLMMCIFIGYYKQMKGRYERYLIMELLRDSGGEGEESNLKQARLQDLDD